MRPHLFAILLLLYALAPAALDAQGRGTGQPPGGGRGQRPPRDAAVDSAERTGTATISGRVVAADTGRALKRARVVIFGAGRPRIAMTDESGHYRIAGLPAGTYTITASKTGFAEAAFGQRRRTSEGTPVQIADGQQLANADLALARGAVIAGRVLDEDGEPLARVVVQVLRHQYQRGEKRLAAAANDQTDDRGQYRVFGLPPGEYVVSATVPATQGVMRRLEFEPAPLTPGADVTDSSGYAPTYYPGVITPAEAAAVRLGAAEEMNGVDFQLQMVRLATVRGTTTEPRGVVALVPEEGPARARLQILRGAVQPDGTFSIRNVPPGKYIAALRSDGPPSPAAALQPIVVAGEDLVIALLPSKNARLGGAVTFESSRTAPPSTFEAFRVTAQPLGPTLPGFSQPAKVLEKGQFTLADLLPGEYVIQAVGAPGWTMKAVYLDGRDVTDQPVEVRSGENASGLNIVFTDRISALGGVVRQEGDTPASGITVVVFPQDEKLWRPQTRRIRAARADQNGTYRLANLPPGDYLVVATEDVEQGEWFDPAFLGSVRDKGERISIAEGEQKTQILKAS